MLKESLRGENKVIFYFIMLYVNFSIISVFSLVKKKKDVRWYYSPKQNSKDVLKKNNGGELLWLVYSSVCCICLTLYTSIVSNLEKYHLLLNQ
jgi:hypothetical protein